VATPSEAEALSRRHFDDVASTWVDRYESVPSFRTRLRVVTDVCRGLMGSSGGARVLDLGSGPGVLGTALSAWASVVVCVDTSWAMLHAGGLAQGRVEEVLNGMGVDHRSGVVVRVAGSTSALAGARTMPFDLVLAVSVLEYQADPHAFLAGMAALVAGGGFMVFTVPNRRSCVRRVERPFDSLSARIGQLFGIERLTHRSYSSSRPFGSRILWEEALGETGAVCREVIALPLGDVGLRSALRPNLLVTAQMP